MPLGICGTFMGGLAQLAMQKGIEVAGCDENIYPPMSNVLAEQGIKVDQGFSPKNITDDIDLYVVGNVVSRGNPLMEEILNKKLSFVSGPQFLTDSILENRHVIAISGTHGKTSTSSMITKVLLDAGLDVGYMIAGRALDLNSTASLGSHEYFVIEADEYDTAFFDKRSKFIHYNPSTLLINNLEFDHADIFDNLSAIKRQFHHLLRIMPSQAQVIYPEDDKEIADLTKMGIFCKEVIFNSEKNSKGWHVKINNPECASFKVFNGKKLMGEINWGLIGEHNKKNALATFVIADSLGVKGKKISESLSNFKGTARRMETIGKQNSITVYDDFAHHPTAIKFTLDGLRKKVGKEKIICLLEMRSNTMASGYHDAVIPKCLEDADRVFLFSKNATQVKSISEKDDRFTVCKGTREFMRLLPELHEPNSHIICLSNGSFDQIHHAILERL
jgi:UDP-N-acetylmuramate: L-alanyl-gamma-D-glutamyl-meso-diaminopimelate ligase